VLWQATQWEEERGEVIFDQMTEEREVLIDSIILGQILVFRVLSKAQLYPLIYCCIQLTQERLDKLTESRTGSNESITLSAGSFI
jgi:hypothetical protein